MTKPIPAELMEALLDENEKLKSAIGAILKCEYDGRGLTDCIDNDNRCYPSAELAAAIAQAEALLRAKQGGANELRRMEADDAGGGI